MPCIVLEGHELLVGTFCLHLRGRRLSFELKNVVKKNSLDGVTDFFPATIGHVFMKLVRPTVGRYGLKPTDV